MVLASYQHRRSIGRGMFRLALAARGRRQFRGDMRVGRSLIMNRPFSRVPTVSKVLRAGAILIVSSSWLPMTCTV